MKRLAPWLLSALAGLLLIFFVNASPLSRLGVSVELPFGWHSPADKQVCIFDDPVPNNEGLPFSMNRAGGDNGCGLEYNNAAIFLNALTGLVIGLTYTFIASSRWPNAKSKVN